MLLPLPMLFAVIGLCGHAHLLYWNNPQFVGLPRVAERKNSSGKYAPPHIFPSNTRPRACDNYVVMHLRHVLGWEPKVYYSTSIQIYKEGLEAAATSIHIRIDFRLHNCYKYLPRFGCNKRVNMLSAGWSATRMRYTWIKKWAVWREIIEKCVWNLPLKVPGLLEIYLYL